jgi:glycosyltransferase involved in cell wall biosynthesis
MLARGLQARGHEIVVLGYPSGMLEDRMSGIAPFEPVLRGMDLHPVTMLKARNTLRKHASQVVLALMKKDVRLTVPAARTMGIPSVVRHANDRALGGGLYDRIFFGAMPAHHIVNSQATRATLLASAPWIDEKKVTVIYNGIDPVPFETADAASIDVPRGALKVGFAGRLEIRKGLMDLARAWRTVASALPDAWLVIVGKGADESHARALLEGAPRVKWLGYRQDIPSLLRGMDILVVPSHWEGFGLIAAEGLAAGVPVVATAASSLREIIDDGKTGRLVPPHDPEALAKALIEAAYDPDANARMSVAGKAKVRNDFSVERMVEAYEKTLAEIVESSGRGR